VTPQSTQATTPTKTPEQMQQDAKDKGVLSIWPEFSWWYPWFKTVAEVNLPLDGGTTCFRFEFVPLAFSLSGCVKSGAQYLINELENIVLDVGTDTFVGWIGGIIAAKVASYLAGQSSWFALAIALGIYAGIQLASAFLLETLFGKKGLIASVVAFFISISVGAFLAGMQKLKDFGEALLRGISGEIESVWNSWWGRSLGFVDIVNAAAWFFIDVGLGAFLITQI
jgi:hypothetical protein